MRQIARSFALLRHRSQPEKPSTEFRLASKMLCIYVDRFPRVTPVLCAGEEMVVAALGGLHAHTRCGPDFRDQFGHRLVPLSPFLSMPSLRNIPGIRAFTATAAEEERFTERRTIRRLFLATTWLRFHTIQLRQDDFLLLALSGWILRQLKKAFSSSVAGTGKRSGSPPNRRVHLIACIDCYEPPETGA